MHQLDHDLEKENTQVRKTLREDPTIASLLSRMPESVQHSFTEEQLANLRIALGARSWGKHKIDFRSTISFFSYRYYYVFVAGRNRRELSRSEKRKGLLIQSILMSSFLVFCSMLGLLVLYLVKSALGIDLFPNFSLGIWSWFKGNIMS
ncbi:3-phosphoshikimate 1-carboxyvinyltransferase [Pseudoalteromonas sp. G4]|uniref:3-phosphoshikimate 1-carboxyvinyltransferase n=1 Tax=Pseudoalteromonas sp. G4 TaxID=2992761 RepID=UPI00237D89AB|nr:3-phosphoshikimate 1-carboxyvinyltransferase [Pseudoalteromonas sp. G4]MDE3273715.1 3-phosphoshikimate 1-carboxyvinyltransferase [Pseudoalteromonas sp. G4]